MTTPLDTETLHLLRHQKVRLNAALAQIPPDRVLAAEIQVTIDEILDRRPRVHSVAPDGEIVLDDQSPWVKAQAAVNETGKPEKVLTAEQHAELLNRLPHTMFGSITDDESSGGLGLLDRPPTPPTNLQPEPLSREAEDEIRRFGKGLGL